MRKALKVLSLAVGLSVVGPLAGHATPLADAIKKGDAGAVQALIAKGANVNEPDGGIAPLGIALSAKDLNRSAVEAKTAGVADQAAGIYAITKALLDHGADPNVPVQNGGYAQLAPLFKSLGMDPTPVNWSLWFIDPASAALLLQHKARVHPNALIFLEFAVLGREGSDHPYSEGFYADLDSRAGKIADLLIPKGAKFVGSALSKGVPRAQVALMGLAQSLCVNTVKLLIERGADVNAIVEKGATKAKLLKALEDAYAQENMERKDVGFPREVWTLIKGRQVTIMQMLIAHGAQEQ